MHQRSPQTGAAPPATAGLPPLRPPPPGAVSVTCALLSLSIILSYSSQPHPRRGYLIDGHLTCRLHIHHLAPTTATNNLNPPSPPPTHPKTPNNPPKKPKPPRGRPRRVEVRDAAADARESLFAGAPQGGRWGRGHWGQWGLPAPAAAALPPGKGWEGRWRWVYDSAQGGRGRRQDWRWGCRVWEGAPARRGGGAGGAGRWASPVPRGAGAANVGEGGGEWLRGLMIS